jgi:hypothetical protein
MGRWCRTRRASVAVLCRRKQRTGGSAAGDTDTTSGDVVDIVSTKILALARSLPHTAIAGVPQQPSYTSLTALPAQRERGTQMWRVRHHQRGDSRSPITRFLLFIDLVFSLPSFRASLTESLFLGTEKSEFSLPKNNLVADLATTQNKNRKLEPNSVKSNVTGNQNLRSHSSSSSQAEFVHNIYNTRAKYMQISRTLLSRDLIKLDLVPGVTINVTGALISPMEGFCSPGLPTR